MMSRRPTTNQNADGAKGSAALQSGVPYLFLTYTQGHADNPAFLGLPKMY
jgi:hypothetical protein